MPGGAEDFLRVPGDRSRIEREELFRVGLAGRGNHGDDGVVTVVVDERGGRVGEEHHVAPLDRLETGDAGAVETDPYLEELRVERGGRDRDVVPSAEQIGKPQVDEVDLGVERDRDEIVTVCRLAEPRREFQVLVHA